MCERAALSIVLVLVGCASEAPKGSDPVVPRDAATEVTVDAGPIGPPDAEPEAEPVTDAAADARPETSVGACIRHVGDQCDIVKQDCPGERDSCVYDGQKGHTVCFERKVSIATAGQSCTSDEDCDRGLFCIGEGNGRCSPACCPGDDSPCGTGTCLWNVNDESKKLAFNACRYSERCQPFQYDCQKGEVCIFSSSPSTFACSRPIAPGSVSTAPGMECTYANECGEMQMCIRSSTGPGRCRVNCFLRTPPAGFEPGRNPGDRFAANGTCDIAGKNYGTCRPVTDLGDGLGVCIPD